jgi:hypothetical protein
MDLGSDIFCSARDNEKSYDVFVYIFIFLNYFSLIIFIIFASLFERKALPRLDAIVADVTRCTSISFAELLWRSVEALRHGIEWNKMAVAET